SEDFSARARQLPTSSIISRIGLPREKALRRHPPAAEVSSRLRALSTEVRALENRLREGGGPDKVAKLHKQGKLSARERVNLLCDEESRFLEIGLLVAYDEYEGQAPAAGVVTGVGIVQG